MNIKQLPRLIVALAVVATLASCGGNSDSSQQNTTTPAQLADAGATTGMAPASHLEFEAYDTQGNLRKSSEWIGQKAVVINFWGTWCPPCRAEIPDLVKLYDEYRDKGVEIVGLALNDNPQKVEAFAKQAGMEWEMLIGTPEIAQQFGISAVPTTIFIDAQGNITSVPDMNGSLVQRYEGARPHETFKKAVDKLIG